MVSYGITGLKRVKEELSTVCMNLYINPILWSTNIIIKIKLLIYNTIGKSILYYVAEAWTLKRKHKNKLMITEMDYLRGSARISRRDKIRNSTIRGTMQITKILSMR